MWVLDGSGVFQGAVACLAAALALVLLRAAPRKPANQFFGLFMSLVALNFAAGFFLEGFLAGGDAAGARLAERVAWQALILDPAALLYFALLYPRRHASMDRAWVVGGIALPALALTAVHLAAPWVFVAPLPGSGEPALDPAARALDRFAVIAVMAAYYLASVALLARSFAREPSPIVRDRLALCLLGFGIAVFPRVGFIPYTELPLPLPDDPLSITSFVVRTIVAFVPLVAVYALARRAAAPGLAPRVDRVFGAMAVVVLLIMAVWLTASPGLRPLTGLSNPPKVVYALRWLVFGAVVGYGVAKYQVFDVELRAKLWTRRGAALAGVVVAAGVAHLVASSLAQSSLPVVLAADGGALALAALPAMRLGGILATRAFPAARTGDEAYLHACRMEVYWAHLDEVLARGPLGEAEARSLAKLRKRLDIAEREHVLIEHMVRRGADASILRAGAAPGGLEPGSPRATW